MWPHQFRRLSVPFSLLRMNPGRIAVHVLCHGLDGSMSYVLFPIVSASDPLVASPMCLNYPDVYTKVTAVGCPDLSTSPLGLSFHLTQTFYSKISHGASLKSFQFLVVSSLIPVFQTREAWCCIHGSLVNAGLSVTALHFRSLRAHRHWHSVAFCSLFSVCLANWNTSSSKSCFLFPKAFWLVFASGYSFSLWPLILLRLNNLSLRSVVLNLCGLWPPWALISDMPRNRYFHYNS